MENFTKIINANVFAYLILKHMKMAYHTELRTKPLTEARMEIKPTYEKVQANELIDGTRKFHNF